MKNIKSVLAAILALCLILSLAVPTFATEANVLMANEASAATEATVDVTEGDEATAEATKPVESSAETTEAATTDDEHEGHDHTVTTGAKEEPSGAMKVVRIIIAVLEVIASVVLVLIIMLQSGKESGLSGALSGNSDTYLSKSGKSLDKVLAKATKWVALVWLGLTLALCLLP